MEFEEDMRPEKNTMPNYFNELSGFDEYKSEMTIIKYAPIYELEIKDNNVDIEYASDVEYND